MESVRSRGPRQCSVLTVGEALVDVVVPHGGGERESYVGGSPANVAVGLAALDHDSRLTACLGHDAAGRRVREHLLDADVVLTPGSTDAPRTSTATAHLDADGVASYEFDLVWELGPQDLHGVGHLHTGSIATTLEPGASAVLEVMSRARRTATVSYDPNCRPTVMGDPHAVRSRIEECIGRSDVVKASVEDVAWLYGEDTDVVEVAELWGRLSPELVVLTRGGDGALAHLPRQGATVELPAPPVEVVDTVGAGDSFMAGLLSGLLDAGLLGSPEARVRLRQVDPDAVAPALHRAVACGAWTVARAGAAAPTRADLP
ncbi:carbohydrate kinase family protein [Ornithinimicrobium pekingense]|uniref:Ribokinase n=1 Tax=Ornithinimicrobium pekingense TaxID=384677 RepID=A0ABQ2FA77_9MICO|nr:carbohydrate kinase [Ornithinimicrobium pekingense]GGK66000.1 ribokinase [Ornithinimicrobium pekingense]